MFDIIISGVYERKAENLQSGGRQKKGRVPVWPTAPQNDELATGGQLQ